MDAILALDGGGIRGAAVARFLAQGIEKRSGKKCAGLFKLIAGTSTGGIIGCGLTTRRPADLTNPSLATVYSAQELVELYQSEGRKIFSRDFEYELASLDGVNGPKYPATGIETVLNSYFGDRKLSDAVTKLLVTACDACTDQPSFFKSWRSDAGNYLMRDVARATSAAPTYFPPLLAGEEVLVDGGILANNPTMCALAEWKSLIEGDESLIVVSVGTGDTWKKICPTPNWGLKDWLPVILSSVMNGASVVTDYIARQFVAPDRYFRFQFDLTGIPMDMDDASAGTISKLIAAADATVEKEAALIDRLLKLIGA